MSNSKCLWHCCQSSLTTYQGKFCSTKCKNKYYVDKRRKALKKQAIEYKGGKCSSCGYNKCVGAMDFHHLGNSPKDFGISQAGHTKSWETLRAELDKCVLLCSNCHREIHYSEAFTDFE